MLKIISFIFFLFFFQNSLSPARADIFDLSYTLTEGGTNRLELDNVNQYRGVRLSVVSDVSTRYELTQRIVQPLESRNKPGLSIQDNLVFRAVPGTNRFGDLRVSTGDMPVRQEELLYVSDNAGNQDSFVLIYGVNRPEEIEPGDYFGRIGFVLRPIGSQREQVTQILEVQISVKRTSADKPLIEISNPLGFKQVILDPGGQERSSPVAIKFNAKFEKPFKIKQFLQTPFESAEGQKLDEAAIVFIVSGASAGTAAGQITPLASSPQHIYSSGPSGEADATLLLNYSLGGDFSGQRAGRYRSKIEYILEEQGLEARIETLEFEVRIDPVFELKVIPQDQKYTIEFLGLKPNDPPKSNEITIEIETNLGKKYQVTQEVYSGLRGREGSVIPDDFFTFYTQDLKTKGKLSFTDKTQMKTGTRTLFISDEKGSSDRFKVVYELSAPEKAPAGDYSTNVTYSLLEI
ncbi:MAG: hypothetical protein PHE18_03315 [Candidatus Omnitrophica bacterium]|nr:hypothetical protein [Candidatus Omnitrophota bacterium]MDD5552885.1 hypothetical protein [Candidatus Omnitrophota bacterium]